MISVPSESANGVKAEKEKYIWYAGYGSNLNRQRFICYIEGGKPKYGYNDNKGCSDKTLPSENKPFTIPYRLYFALPNNNKTKKNWGDGGVAFINPVKEDGIETLCRIWKITKEQYKEVKEQEGPWYANEICLGKEDGVRIYTITNEKKLTKILQPSKWYLKTIAEGLRETYSFNDEEIASYLIGKEGIEGTLSKAELIEIIKNNHV